MIKEHKKIVILSALGGMLEFYDFTIYGLFALYFAAQFFPATDRITALIASYSVFFIGYVVRPIGGIIFSHIGDEFGRKMVLILTMVLMGIASFGLGCLPTYAQIGIWAPILMTTLRLLQGLAIGGELPSMIVYASETVPEKRGFVLGVTFAGTLFGLVFGMLVNVILIQLLTNDQLSSFGWRLPFILGGLLCFVAYQVRKQLHETFVFMNLKEHKKFPLGELLRHHFGKFVMGVGVAAIIATSIMLTLIFMPTYLTKIVNISAELSTHAVFFAALVSVFSIYVTGRLADKISPYVLMQYSLLGFVLSGAIGYFALSQHINLYASLFLLAVFEGALVAISVVLLSTIFPANIRLTGVALSYNVAFVLFGGLMPVIIMPLIEHTQMPYLIPFLWLVFVVVLSFSAIQMLKNYSKRGSVNGYFP